MDVLGRDSTGLADREHKRWELVPESSAIVKGAEAALASIVPNSRRYTAIVTSARARPNLGWFRWIAPRRETALYFFSAKTCLVGCDDVDDRLPRHLGVLDNDRPLLFPMVRRRSQSSASTDL